MRQSILYAGLLSLLGMSLLSGCRNAEAPVRKNNEAAPVQESSETAAADAADIADASADSAGAVQDADTEEIQQILENMTLEEKVCQLFIITPEQLTGVDTAVQAGDATREAYENCPVGGLVYFAKNLQNPEQTKTMLENTARYAKERIGLPVFLTVDEEGGQVTRVAGNPAFDVPEFPNLSEIGAAGDTDEAYELGEQIGSYLKELGFNMDMAPVADVLTNPENTVVKERAFSSDPETAGRMALAEWRGLKSQGILGVYKHFPGHGGTAGDSHNGYAYVDDTLEELKSGALIPFQEGIDAGISVIMAGHISCPQVTGDDTPATMSYTLISEILRGDMGFDGIVVTDALNMGAVTEQYTSGEAALTALNAGADLLLMPEDFQDAYQAVLQAAENGELSEARIDESAERILRVKIQMIGEGVAE